MEKMTNNGTFEHKIMIKKIFLAGLATVLLVFFMIGFSRAEGKSVEDVAVEYSDLSKVLY